MSRKAALKHLMAHDNSVHNPVAVVTGIRQTLLYVKGYSGRSCYKPEGVGECCYKKDTVVAVITGIG